MLASFLYVMLYNSLHITMIPELICIIIKIYSVWRGCTMSQSIACFIFGFSLAPCHVRPTPSAETLTNSSFTYFIHHAQLNFIVFIIIIQFCTLYVSTYVLMLMLEEMNKVIFYSLIPLCTFHFSVLSFSLCHV